MQKMAWRKKTGEARRPEEVGTIVQVKDDDGTLDGNGGSGTVDLDRLQNYLEGNSHQNW